MPAPYPPKVRITRHIKVCAYTGCWNWTRTKDKRGYGRVSVFYKSMLAHRQSYLDFKGPIPDGMELDHLCMNPSCVNPDHLEPVTRKENARRAAEAGVLDRKSDDTHCGSGHEYTPENTRFTPQGWRDCRECARLKTQRLRKAKRKPGVIHNKYKTHCKRGHEFSQTNTYVSPKGHRFCRSCLREWKKTRRSK